MEDNRIVDLYWHRSQQAISETQGKYGAYCLSIAGNIVPSREDAPECVNDTYLAAWNAMLPNRPDGRHLLVACREDRQFSRLGLLDFETGQMKTLNREITPGDSERVSAAWVNGTTPVVFHNCADRGYYVYIYHFQ